MSTTYNKYIAKLQFGCAQLQTIVTVIGRVSKGSTKEDIDERITAIDQAIKYLQDIKRAMLYFKNSL